MGLRVAIVAPWGERLGGAEEMLWLALSHCDRQRLEPMVVFLGPGPFVEEVAGLGIETVVIPAGRLRQPRSTGAAIRRLASLLKQRRAVVLLNWSAKAQLYGAPAAVAAGLGDRIVWWQHQIPEGHWVDRIATALPAQAIGCSSRAGQRAQAGLRPRRRSFVVNPGIDPGVGGNGRSGLREELAIPPGRLVVGMVGRLQPWKGQDRFLAALAELRARGRPVHGLLVGGDAYDLSPRYAAELERMVPELGLSEWVTMTGQVDDARPYFELMDVAVNASEAEPFGIVLLEAMAAGAAVVAVASGGPLDIVEPGVNGVLAESGQPGALAEAIDSLLRDPARRAEMAREGAVRCRERFAARGMADRLTDALIEVAGG
jgi:glycosyltransferase involved in cell wall biosynthesis